MNRLDLPVGKRQPFYRFLEILPGLSSYGMIALLFILSLISPIAGAIYLLIIIITTVVKAIGIAIRTIQGDNLLRRALRVDWVKRLQDLENPHDAYDRLAHSDNNSYGHDQHLRNLRMMAVAEPRYFPKPSEIYHAVIISLYNESADVLIPTLESVKNSEYPRDRLIVLLAYEERGGEATEQLAQKLTKKYQKSFHAFIPVKHPAKVRNEVIGKGGNITNAGRALKDYIAQQKIRADRVIVTTLDSDNRPHPSYFNQCAYEYIVREDRKRLSYQPVSLFMSNIWDAPAPMRIIAVGNSFWNIISAMRPHTLRNFASHSQPLDALIEMDFWSTRTIVEDGHQYWRSLFHFDGNYEVVPIRAPIYQDAVLSDTIWKTFKAQFIQLRRWDYGASDIAYVGTRLFSRKRPMSFWGLLPKFIRLFDSHITLAAVAPIVAFGGWIPSLFHAGSRDLITYQLPQIVATIQIVAFIGLCITILLSFKMLPPRPPRYRRSRNLLMLLQWILMPVVSIVYSSAAAFYSQTRLMLGLYMDKFDVTDKAVKK